MTRAVGESAEGADAALQGSGEIDALASEQLDSSIDVLLAQYRGGTLAIANNRDATAELKRNYRQLQLTNRELRERLQAEKNSELLDAFDAYERSKAEFMKTLSVKERSYNLLVKEFEALQEYLHNMQTTVGNYRKSVHKLVIERGAIAEENKQLREQQEVTNKLVARLNRNYDALRNEYTKLFETTR